MMYIQILFEDFKVIIIFNSIIYVEFNYMVLQFFFIWDYIMGFINRVKSQNYFIFLKIELYIVKILFEWLYRILFFELYVIKLELLCIMCNKQYYVKKKIKKKKKILVIDNFI